MNSFPIPWQDYLSFIKISSSILVPTLKLSLTQMLAYKSLYVEENVYSMSDFIEHIVDLSHHLAMNSCQLAFRYFNEHHGT